MSGCRDNPPSDSLWWKGGGVQALGALQTSFIVVRVREGPISPSNRSESYKAGHPISSIDGFP